MMVPSAWVSTTAGSVVSPPQWPECTPPGRRSTTRSKWNVPRVPVAMVGTSGITRGPSLPISTSACQQVLVRGDEVAQADRAALLAGLQHQLQVEAQPAAALRQHRLQRGEVQRVLTLVVGGAAAVPAIAFLGEPPRIEARAPLVLQSAHRVAVAVGEDGRPRGVLHPFGGQDRAEAGVRIGVDRDGEAHALQPRADRRVEVALHVGFVAGVLRGAGDRHQFGQPVAEAAFVEELCRSRYCALTCSHPAPLPFCVPGKPSTRETRLGYRMLLCMRSRPVAGSVELAHLTLGL